MTKVKILGDAMVIESTVKMEELKRLAKFRPEALKLVDGETKDELFAISVGATAGISKYGITYNNKNETGFATATIMLPEGLEVDKKKKFVSDNYTDVLINTKLLEDTIKEAMEEFNTAVAIVEENIEIV